MDYQTLILTSLDILVAFIGVLFVIAMLYEYTKLNTLRKDFDTFKTAFRRDLHLAQKAMQRVIASYGIADMDKRIELLQQAVALDPNVFNGYNALGYAYLDKGDVFRAIEAFREAVYRHPDEKEGYCDLAYAYLKAEQLDLCIEKLQSAVQVDPSSVDDLKDDPRFSGVLESLRARGLAGVV